MVAQRLQMLVIKCNHHFMSPSQPAAQHWPIWPCKIRQNAPKIKPLGELWFFEASDPTVLNHEVVTCCRAGYLPLFFELRKVWTRPAVLQCPCWVRKNQARRFRVPMGSQFKCATYTNLGNLLKAAKDLRTAKWGLTSQWTFANDIHLSLMRGFVMCLQSKSFFIPNQSPQGKVRTEMCFHFFQRLE